MATLDSPLPQIEQKWQENHFLNARFTFLEMTFAPSAFSLGLRSWKNKVGQVRVFFQKCIVCEQPAGLLSERRPSGVVTVFRPVFIFLNFF